MPVYTTRYISEIFPTFGSAADGKFVERDSVTLQGNNGSWVTIAASQWEVEVNTAQIWRLLGNDWSGYSAYRVKYKFLTSGVETDVSSYETIAFDWEKDADGDTMRVSMLGADGQTSGAAIKSLVVNFIYALGGAIAGKLSILSANGAIAIGNPPPTSASAGTGIWIDRTGIYLLNGSALQMGWIVGAAVNPQRGVPASHAGLSGTLHNVANGGEFYLVGSSTGVFTIDGFADHQNGTTLYVANNSANQMTLGHLTGSTGSNQIDTGTGANLNCKRAILVYTGSVWLVMAYQ